MNATTKTYRRFSRLLAGLVLCLAAASLTGCGFFSSQPQAPTPPATPPQTAPQPVAPPTPPKPAAVNTVAVLLPLGGPYREFGGKVQKGIKAAQDALAAAGTPLDVTIIDVTQPGWVDALRALPPEIMLVGGPMNPLSLKELQTVGLLQSRAFVTFLPSIGETREGIDAWRFFPSHEDEIDSLLRLALTDYGITQFGILRPDGRYAQGMGEAFGQAVTRLGGQVTATGVYSLQAPATWEATVADMLRTGSGHPGFGAVFIPDDWDKADKVLPYFFRNKVEDLLILGTQVWTEALFRFAAAKTQINIQNYRLAVCPGAWWPDNQGKATQDLLTAMRAAGDEHPDMWEAIGYDFARMAARMGPLPQGAAPQDVSARLARATSGMDFSMAPVSYTPDGKAHVAMYLFRPSVAGPVLLDPEGFRQRLNAIRQKALENPAPETEQSYSPGQPPAGQTAPAPAQPMPSQPAPVQPAPAQPAPPQSAPPRSAPATTATQAPGQPADLMAPVPAHRQALPTS